MSKNLFFASIALCLMAMSCDPAATSLYSYSIDNQTDKDLLLVLDSTYYLLTDDGVQLARTDSFNLPAYSMTAIMNRRVGGMGYSGDMSTFRPYRWPGLGRQATLYYAGDTVNHWQQTHPMDEASFLDSLDYRSLYDSNSWSYNYPKGDYTEVSHVFTLTEEDIVIRNEE